MKQATNPFAPVPLWRKQWPGYAAMSVATIAMAVGLISLQHARTTVAGTLLPVSEADAAIYGISAVYQLDDGSYRVEISRGAGKDRLYVNPRSGSFYEKKVYREGKLVGAALIGHAVGDKVEITLPNGATICYEVLDISRSAI